MHPEARLHIIVAALVGALTLGARGVETEAQLRFLRAIGCDLMQGYWLARPLPAAEAYEVIVGHTAVS